MEELLMLSLFNLLLFGVLIYVGRTGRINLVGHVACFIIYNVILYVSFFTNGEGGQGFAWVFIGAVFSVTYFIGLLVLLLVKRRKQSKE